MPERTNGTVLKIVERKLRGFESHSLRHVMSRDIEDALNPQLGSGRFLLVRVGPLCAPVAW